MCPRQRARTVAKLPRLALGLPLFTVLIACPGTTPTPPEVSEVALEGSVLAPSFGLVLRGRGFALGSVRYDLNQGSGEAQGRPYVVQILDNPGTVVARASGTEVTVRSNLELAASFTPAMPLMLERAPFEVDLLEGTVLLVAVRDAIPVSGAVDAGARPEAGPTDGGDPRDLGPAE